MTHKIADMPVRVQYIAEYCVGVGCHAFIGYSVERFQKQGNFCDTCDLTARRRAEAYSKNRKKKKEKRADE